MMNSPFKIFLVVALFLSKISVFAADDPLVIVDTINELLRENNIERLSVRRYGRIIALVGTPTDDQEKRLALRIARAVHGQVEDHTASKTGGAPTLIVDVMFVEMEKQDALQMGFGAKPGNEGRADAPGETILGMSYGGASYAQEKFSIVTANYLGFLNLVRSKRSSRVLSHPRILGRSGEVAEFHAGGKATYGYEVPGANGKSEVHVKEIEYGVKLNVTPFLDKAGNIDTRISAEVSDLAPTTAAHQIADLALTNIKTAITIGDGDSALLSGLTSRKQMKEVDKVPLLGDIPLVGELFKSRKSKSLEKDLLILITLKRSSRLSGHAEQFKEFEEKTASDVKFSFFD